MSTTKVMLVDDEPQAKRVLRIALISHGFEVMEARDGEGALIALRNESPDVILLDLKMPGIGGLDACRLIRERSEVPIIIVSAKDGEKDKVKALENGADDYVTKPAAVEELVARIHAVTRRPSLASHSRVFRLDSIEIDLESHEVRRGDTLIHLTSKEFKLLYYFLQNPGIMVTHRRLLQAVWGPDYGNELEYLRVFINQLRKKIEPDPARPIYILTEPSCGYRFAPKGRILGKSF